MLLAADGWVQFLRPLDEKSTSLTFKKGQQGLSVSFTQGLGRPDQSGRVLLRRSDHCQRAVSAGCDRHRVRPAAALSRLHCAAAFDATLDFFRKEMQAIGWKPLSAADTAARWPNAKLSETIENGARAYYSHDRRRRFYRQQPIMLTLQRRDDGKTSVDIRIAPFALPQTLEADSETAGLPKPKPTKSCAGIRRARTRSAASSRLPSSPNSRDACLLSPRTCRAELDGGDQRRGRHRGQRLRSIFPPPSRPPR